MSWKATVTNKMEDSVKAMMNVDKVVNVPTSSTSENDGNKNIDLFVVPHSRMRDLVSWPLSEVASAVDIQDLEPCLQAVYEAMWEMKTHEYIENNYIMNRLKARLQTKRVC